ncbi:MAG: N-acetylmuramic acid/N-acetylglucosamine kinase [Candidatus Roseilinea sp.]|nr:MAG: N-acetylmuramic acid/N-acetylglucosamine kinase [Candidatus Roseilinea sp.]
MAYDVVIGIDGGQTSTKCALVACDGRVLAYGQGGGLVHLAAAGARERHASALREAFASAWANAGLEPQPVAAIGLGLTGIEDGSPEAALARQIVSELIEARTIAVHSDAYAALIGAHGNRPGIIAISGTGSHILGRNAAGELARAGGWGWLLGDEGSALWIGRSGLMAALHAYDGVGEPTMLEGLMREHFQVQALGDVKRRVYDSSFGAKGFAALAPLVSQAAAQGDAIAQSIVTQAARDLATQVMAVQRRLALPPDAPVAPVGGAYAHVHGLRAKFTAALCEINPQANVVDPLLSPVLGAALIALQACGCRAIIRTDAVD